MRELVNKYLGGALARREFLRGLLAAGFAPTAARAIVRTMDADGGAPAVSGAPRSQAVVGTGGDLPFSASTKPVPKPRSQAVVGTGGDLLAEQIKAAGVRYIFTNPGSSEAGFFDALTDRPTLQLILGLHEGVVLSMADGYHKMTRETAFVNVHAIAGTAQMAGQLYNAHRDGSAIVVTAAMNDTTVYSDDLLLAPRPGFSQAEVNRDFSKSSWEVRDAASIPLATRRAFKVAAAAPGGPVYLCVSSLALGAAGVRGEIWAKDTFAVQVRPRPAKDQIDTLADWLLTAQRPILLIGDEVWKSNASKELVQLVDLLGLPVTTMLHSTSNFPNRHPQYVGWYRYATPFPTGSADLLVQLGTRDPGGEPFGPKVPVMGTGARLAAVGIDANALGRTQPLDLAIVADVREACRDLTDSIRSQATADRLSQIRKQRLQVVGPASSKRGADMLESARKNFSRTTIHPDRLVYEMEQSLDLDAVIVAENFLFNASLMSLGPGPGEKMWIGNTGMSLGWGVGAAIGVKLGEPNRQVVLLIGDGSLMYSAAGFWTMARYGVPLLIIVANNRDYGVVRQNFHAYNGRMKASGHYHGLFLGDPNIDFVKLAESQHVQGARAVSSGGLAAAIRRGVQATRAGEPYLLEVAIERVADGADSTWYQKFSLAETRKRKV